MSVLKNIFFIFLALFLTSCASSQQKGSQESKTASYRGGLFCNAGNFAAFGSDNSQNDGW